MPTRQLTRIRTLWNRSGRTLSLLGIRELLVPSLVAGLCLPFLVHYLPRTFQDQRLRDYEHAWAPRVAPLLEEVDRRWREPFFLGEIRKGDEPAIVALLREHPLVQALARVDRDELWIREGERLVRASRSPEADLYRAWVWRSLGSKASEWHPGSGENPRFLTDAVSVFRHAPWVSIRIWRVGSPAVEAHLRMSIGPESPFRVGLMRINEAEVPPPTHPLPAWGEPPNIQVNLYRGRKTLFGGLLFSTAFGPDWTWWCIESEKDELALTQIMRSSGTEGYLLAGMILVVLWTALFLWQRRRVRELLDRDRLASMAHSLKTPLGLVKLRCDIQLHKLGLEHREIAGTLMRVSEDVDHLTLFVEDCLKGFSGARAPHETALITADWFRDVTADLAPAFQVEGRTLVLDLAPASLRAHGVLLRSAMMTLLENALKYGAGPVLLRTSSIRNRFRIEVRDEGEGLDAAQLSRLATPFMRFREPRKEGFAQEGRGLGLFLLARSAMQEGWALAFTSAPGQGFTATLEMHS